MRTKLTVKNPKPASPTRAPVRSGSLVARKAVRPAAPSAADKPARPKKASAPAASIALILSAEVTAPATIRYLSRPRPLRAALTSSMGSASVAR